MDREHRCENFFFIGKKLIQETLAFVFSDSNFYGYYKLRFSAQFFKMLGDIKTKGKTGEMYANFSREKVLLEILESPSFRSLSL